MNISDLKYISDDKGDLAPRARQAGRIAVIVPIEVWEELTGGDETSYLLRNETMKKRLLAAKNRQTGMSLSDSESLF